MLCTILNPTYVTHGIWGRYKQLKDNNSSRSYGLHRLTGSRAYDNQSPLILIVMIPTAKCLVDFIILDQIVGAVIVTVLGPAQLGAVFG